MILSIIIPVNKLYCTSRVIVYYIYIGAPPFPGEPLQHPPDPQPAFAVSFAFAKDSAAPFFAFISAAFFSAASLRISATPSRYL